MTKLVLWGAGGHGKVVLDIALALHRWTEIVFVDDAYAAGAGVYMNHPMGPRPADDLPVLRAAGFSEFVVTMGNNADRSECFAKAIAYGFTPATLIHPSAAVSPSASVDGGSVVMAMAAINAQAIVGRNCIVNTGAIVEHDCAVGDHSHIAPGAVLGGGVRMGAFSFAGINAAILPLIEIGEGAVVGAGAVVNRDVPSGETVAGVPARIIARKLRAEGR